MEIDFLIRKKAATSSHDIPLIEVKSSAQYSLTSLIWFGDRFSGHLCKSFVLHAKDLDMPHAGRMPTPLGALAAGTSPLAHSLA